jgi:hypothetical protein
MKNFGAEFGIWAFALLVIVLCAAVIVGTNAERKHACELRGGEWRSQGSLCLQPGAVIKP